MLDMSNTEWPFDTELIVSLGTNKVMLTIQHPLICMILHNTFENLRVSLLFKHAFPDAILIPTFISSALIAATKVHRVRVLNIYKHLSCDESYLVQMACLVSNVISNWM
jgi:hypothetical protein